MFGKALSKFLGLDIFEININEEKDFIVFNNYYTYGGGGPGNKNGHYGCKHTKRAKRIMSQKKKGKPTWNKGKKGFLKHTEKSKKSISDKLKGSNNGRAILTENDVRDIIKYYLTNPVMSNVGEIQKNGIPMSNDWMFCKTISKKYKVTSAAIKNIIRKKTWKNVWTEFKI